MGKEFRPRLTEEEYELIQGIRNAGKEHGVGLENMDHGWLKSKNTSVHFRNPLYKSPEEVEKEIDFDSIIGKYIEKIPLSIPTTVNEALFDRLVYTDVHIGMNPNENGFSLYGGKWDSDELFDRLNKTVAWVLEHRRSETLLIDELGDFMDGWDGETVRKGHKLPQNMDNELAFDTGLKFKLALIDNLVPFYKKIICHNICNDNHSGSFGYVVNSALKSVIDIRYENVEIINIRRFIDHYFYDRHCFIITHGKDGKNLKFGFKPILDTKQIEKIKNYIDEHRILLKSDYVEFSKGDSHQFITDESTSDTFSYNNYPAYSPSSEWVQTNFKRGKSGFVFDNHYSGGQKSRHPYLFDWKNEREEISIDFSI